MKDDWAGSSFEPVQVPLGLMRNNIILANGILKQKVINLFPSHLTGGIGKILYKLNLICYLHKCLNLNFNIPTNVKYYGGDR
jgi:hypothetical protein